MDEHDAVSCGDSVRACDLLDAAWEALITGRPTELAALERMLEWPLAARVDVPGGVSSLRRLELLLVATERNLRILSGQARMG